MTMPRFAIVNTIDAPIRKHVAEWIEGIGYCYMARAEDPYLKEFDGMRPSAPTAMEAFGFSVHVGDAEATFTLTHPSRATYEDGKPRRWHGYSEQISLPLVKAARRRKRHAA